MLIEITTASPPYKVDQIVAAAELKKRMAGSPVVGRMIETASCLLVSRNVATPGGICGTISAIRSSEIGPGPLGISETSLRADAPCSTASVASIMFWIQQILNRTIG